MTTAELTVAIIAFVLAVTTAFISVCQFMEKGFLFNNAYIWASRTEREQMDKKPYYRQSAIIFCLLSAVFLVIGISMVLQNSKIQLIEIPLIGAAFVYVIVSTVKTEKRMK